MTPAEWQALSQIEKTLGMNIPRAEYDGAPRVLSTFKPAAGGAKSGRGAVRRVTKRRL